MPKEDLKNTVVPNFEQILAKVANLPNSALKMLENNKNEILKPQGFIASFLSPNKKSQLLDERCGLIAKINRACDKTFTLLNDSKAVEYFEAFTKSNKMPYKMNDVFNAPQMLNDIAYAMHHKMDLIFVTNPNDFVVDDFVHDTYGYTFYVDSILSKYYIDSFKEYLNNSQEVIDYTINTFDEETLEEKELNDLYQNVVKIDISQLEVNLQNIFYQTTKSNDHYLTKYYLEAFKLVNKTFFAEMILSRPRDKDGKILLTKKELKMLQNIDKNYKNHEFNIYTLRKLPKETVNRLDEKSDFINQVSTEIMQSFVTKNVNNIQNVVDIIFKIVLQADEEELDF